MNQSFTLILSLAFLLISCTSEKSSPEAPQKKLKEPIEDTISQGHKETTRKQKPVLFSEESQQVVLGAVQADFTISNYYDIKSIRAEEIKIIDRNTQKEIDSFPLRIYGPVSLYLKSEYPVEQMLVVDMSSREGYEISYKYFTNKDGKFSKKTRCYQYFTDLWNNGEKGAQEAQKNEEQIYKNLLPNVVKVNGRFQVEGDDHDWERILSKINVQILKGHYGLFKMLTQPTEKEKAYHKNFDGVASTRPYLDRYSDMLNRAGCWWGKKIKPE